MAKYTRTQIGALYKSKDPAKPNYIKINKSVTLSEGQFVQAESKKFQLESLERAVQAGRLQEENAQKARDRINKIPEFVIAELVVLSQE